MGRVPRVIKTIADKKARNITFNKRYAGAIKKIHELGVLCDKDTFLFVRDRDTGRVRVFSSSEENFHPQYDSVKPEDRKGPRDVQRFYDKHDKNKKPTRPPRPKAWISPESYNALRTRIIACQKGFETAFSIWQGAEFGRKL